MRAGLAADTTGGAGIGRLLLAAARVVVPGTFAASLCVYFGMLARGRVGGILAGLGFMLPGFVLMFLLSWLYWSHGMKATGAAAVVFSIVQAAVGCGVTFQCRIRRVPTSNATKT